MSKNLFIEKPKIKKGRKIVTLILVDNKGEVVFTDWSNVSDNEELKKRIKELER